MKWHMWKKSRARFIAFRQFRQQSTIKKLLTKLKSKRNISNEIHLRYYISSCYSLGYCLFFSYVVVMNYNDLFSYENGALTRKVAKSKRCRIGDPVGWINGNGYLQTSVSGENVLVHRIIWEMHNGKIPNGMEIDHINHDRTDNRIENLRIVNHKDNHKNVSMQSNNKTGVCGVCFIERCNKFRASIKVDGVTIYLGYFSSIDDAKNARKKANDRFNFHKNHGV
ncbi:HNH endonuclease [Salmonella enterica]|nr:HNH endonuclease [Salmonella enterica]